MGKGKGLVRASRSAGWLTRRQVAELLGIDEARVAQLDGRELHPVRRSDGSWTYQPPEVGALLSGQSVSGPITARAFEMFMAGRTDPEVVVATLQPARRIREVRGEYNEMSGSISLYRSQLDRLSTALGGVVASADALATAVEKELAARWRQGFDEGRADTEDLGEVVNPHTGERRRVTRSGPVASGATTRSGAPRPNNR